MSYSGLIAREAILLRERGWRYTKAKQWHKVVDGRMLTARSMGEAQDREWRREANQLRHCKIEQRIGKGAKAKWVWVASARTIHEAEQCLFRDFFCQGRVRSLDEKYTSSVPTGVEKED